MLFIYLLEKNPQYFKTVQRVLERSYERGDQLFTSYLGLAEVMAGAVTSPMPRRAEEIRGLMDEMGFSYLPFVERSVVPFSQLRAVYRVKPADAMNLACAAAAGIDLFLTGDKKLLKVHVGGVNFIGDFETAPL
jgi:predicted nucleic acid-binding protein